MNSKIFIVLFFSMLGLTINLHAQTDKQSAEEIEKQELARKFRQGMQARTMQQMQATSSVAVQSNKYNHRETEIMAKLNTAGIPADFPVYKNEYTDEQYTLMMKNWYAANPSLLKKENTNEQK